MTALDRARAGFLQTYGVEPDGIAFAPGRVNLIGEHVDYNDGLVLPMPITAGTAVAWARRDDASIEAVALDYGCARDRFAFNSIAPVEAADWRSYLRGMCAGMLSGKNPGQGARLAIAGTIPRGSGLSSSASFCVALGRAVAVALGEGEPPAISLALTAQRVEHEWAGVNCGIMDQVAVAAGRAGSALLLDCRDLSTRLVDLPADWAVMVVQSGVVRGLVDGHYNARRKDCEAAEASLGVASLRDASVDLVEVAELDPVVRRRARHVVDEIERVRLAVAAIERGDLVELGTVLRASHLSLRDLFEVSVPEVDALAEALNRAIGAEGGARMTGGGFGGAVVAVMRSDRVARVRAEIEQAYRPPDGGPLSVMIETAGTPAGNQ